MLPKLPLKKYALAFLFLLFQTSLISIFAQTVTVNDNTPNATNVTYTFTFTTTGTIGAGTSTPNVFRFDIKPTGYPDYVAVSPCKCFCTFCGI